MFFDKINMHDTIAFLVGISIGLVILYVYKPPPVVVVKHPTPENVDKVIYQDDDRNCYKYQAKEVKCPVNMNLVLDHPLTIK